MKRKIGTVLICLGLALIVGALGLLGFNLWSEEQAGTDAQTALHVLTQQIPEPTEEEPAPTDGVEPTEPEDLVAGEILAIPNRGPQYLSNPYMEMPGVEVDGLVYIGYLEIPDLGLTLPVINESTDSNLRHAPCRFFGSAYLDNFVIGAHNYNSHFGRLSSLSYGDIVIFTDMAGNVFTYEVGDIETLRSHQGEYLCNGEWDLSLYTCTFTGDNRLTIRCERIDAK